MNISKSIVLPDYNDNLIRAIVGLKIDNRNIRELNGNEVLVKMEATPCNPSDIAFLRGGYNIKKPLPAVPGFEGVGMVIKSGKDSSSFMGKRVSCFVQEDTDGTWAEYFIARSRDCIVVKKEMEIEQAACLSINPLTAIGLFEIMQKRQSKALVQNAAGGQVPEFIRVLAHKYGVDVINIVRKEEQSDQLTSKGNKFVLNSSDENFNQNLSELCSNLKPTIAFDAVAGESSGQILNILPSRSQLIIYGGLSGADLSGIDPMGVIFHQKVVSGFNLNEWIAEKEPDELKKITNHLQDLFINGEFKTNIQAKFQLTDVVTGIRTYIKNMSAGKVLFTP